MKRYLTLFLFLATGISYAQQTPRLSVESIMRDPKWMGTSPSNIRWSSDSKNIYFNWNPDKANRDQLFRTSNHAEKPVKLDIEQEKKIKTNDYIYNSTRTLAAYSNDGDIFLLDVKTGKETRLTNTTERESALGFLNNGKLVFKRGDNLFSLNLNSNELKQLSNFVKGSADKPKSEQQGGKQDQWLKTDQLEQFDIIKKREKQSKDNTALNKRYEQKKLKELFTDEKFLNGQTISPDGRYISYQLIQTGGGKNTIVPNYVTASGYTEDIRGRTKVGSPLTTFENFIYDSERDSVYAINIASIPGIKDLPDYVKDYPKQLEERQKKNADRSVSIQGPFWNSNATGAIVIVTSQDNKDRWIMKLDPSTGKLGLLDRQRDEAWIGGPGMYEQGWLNDQLFYFQSEASGYSHIYTVNVNNGEKKQLTSGKWEVQTLQLSQDKKTFYFTANIEHPGITHFYKMSVNGGKPEKLTTMTGGNEVTLSPDEKWMAIRYSYSNKPWELYVQENKANAKPIQVTQSTSAEFNAYKWREPEVVNFKNRYGDDVYARVYKPLNAHPNHPAVVFVHGAGYLQNVHFWWSQYFREYMFHNLLADNGYTVIDIDYTASSGYGRNHRTGIYRNMGGKDLTDQLDGLKFLTEKYGVNPKHAGIYGGSYGGFITLMAMFKEPEAFAAGAGLRSVTDWAHYNHGYTANILNEPYNDPNAFKKSSPIYYADGLKGKLLMCHGMVDVNVHFQDIVRLSQRLIELGKNNWELAVYPVEDHGFVEPSSWTDEYKRIFKLFEDTLKK